MKATRPQVLRWSGGKAIRCRDDLAIEEPLEIRLDTQPVTVTMRTPGHDKELAAGFLLSEAIVKCREDIRALQPYARNRDGNVLDVFLNPSAQFDPKRLTRHFFASSSCGLCGKATADAVRQHFPPVRARFSVPAELLLTLPAQMRAAQTAFERTGGIHAAAVFTRRGELLVVREDIGRHNAVDKVIGYGLLKGRLPFSRHILLVSGRASFEILQKALAARFAVVCSVSAPSNLAVEFARASGQTLVGFLRDRSLNVYTGRARVCFRRE